MRGLSGLALGVVPIEFPIQNFGKVAADHVHIEGGLEDDKGLAVVEDQFGGDELDLVPESHILNGPAYKHPADFVEMGLSFRRPEEAFKVVHVIDISHDATSQ